MKKNLFLVLAMLVSNVTFAGTDHYLLRDDTHVHHLKVTTRGSEVIVETDVDFEPNASEAGKHACSAQIAGEAKTVSATELLLKKHIEGEAKVCSIKVLLSPNGAKIEQSAECGYFAAGLCHFDTDGKELNKM